MKSTASVNQGRSRWTNHCTGFEVSATYSPSGKIVVGCPSAKTKRSSSPSQNTGIEMPINARSVINRSDHLPAVTAEMIPTTIPQNSQMIPAPIESENVAGSPCLIWSTTSSRCEYEIRLPVKSCFIISPYWTGYGRSRPNSLRMLAMFWSVGSRPAIRIAGSPLGIRKKMMKTITLTIASTATIPIVLLTTNAAIAPSAPPAPSRAGRARRGGRRRRCSATGR